MQLMDVHLGMYEIMQLNMIIEIVFSMTRWR